MTALEVFGIFKMIVSSNLHILSCNLEYTTSVLKFMQN